MMTTDVKSKTGKFIVGMAETDTIADDFRIMRWIAMQSYLLQVGRRRQHTGKQTRQGYN